MIKAISSIAMLLFVLGCGVTRRDVQRWRKSGNVEELSKALAHKDPSVRRSAAAGLAEIADAKTVSLESMNAIAGPSLIRTLNDADEYTRGFRSGFPGRRNYGRYLSSPRSR